MENIVSDAHEVTVRAGTSFGESIKEMDQHKKSIALIVDEETRLLGIVTDGDIRRAILKWRNPRRRCTESNEPKTILPHSRLRRRERWSA